MSRISLDEAIHRHASWTVTALLCATMVAGCTDPSDDGNGSGDTTPPENSAPAFGGDQSVSVDENTTSVATATATDVNGDLLTYAISGGADSGLFEIEPDSGSIAFSAAPDFEQPDDADDDNVYSFTVTATDGNGGSDTAAFTVTVTNVADERYVEQVFAETTITDDILYATVDGQDLVLNVVTPVGDIETDRPFALLATGGAFALTDRSLSIPIAEVFARTGYVAAVMDYRTRGSMPAGNELVVAAQEATHDMLGAVRFMRANASTYGIDPDKIVVGGTSAGAIMAIRAGTLDAGDPMTDDFMALLESMGGIEGTVGDHLDQSSSVQGVYAISGGIFGLEAIDIDSAPIYGAHNELDGVAPCATVMLSEPDLVVSGTVSGTCDFIPTFEVLGVPAGSFIVPGDTEHVDFTDEEWTQFTTEALMLYKSEIIDVE